ncbi:MAG: AraC family transcriptional regulator [Verrucomicrobia bacterium]|nr:AraC family transcriptional regulator [Verrucomicrobiota bacterium]
MELLLSSDLPAKVLADLRNLGIEAEIDTGASLEKSVQRARREQTVLMVPVQSTDFQPEVLRRAPGVIALGKKAFDRSGLAGSVATILRGFYPEQYLNHFSVLHGSGPSQAVFRAYENLSMQEGITIPRGSHEQFLHYGKTGVEELHRAGILLGGFTRTGRGYFVERRAAGFHILGLVLQGVLEVHPEGQSCIQHRVGSCFFIPAGFRGFYRANRPAEFLWLHIQPGAFGLPAGGQARKTNSFRAATFMQTARCFLEESRNSESDRSLVLQRLVQLMELQIYRLVRSFGFDKSGDSGREKLHQVVQKIEEDISAEWSVPKLARIAGLSVSKLYREIHQHYQKSPGSLVEEIRIRHATELLSHFDHKLQQVAAMTGYADSFSFSRAFKRVMKVSPSEYRQMTRSNQK